MAKKKRASSKSIGNKKAGRSPGGNSLDPDAQRLNKVLAAAGLGSRREVEELIVQGRVEVNREIVTDLACKVNPKAVTLKVDGQVLRKPRLVYFALNKPKGVLSTNKDPSGRIRVIDLVPDGQRVFSVGRLDRNSEGLMLLTNDGELAQKLAHPSYRVQKTYFVVVSGNMTEEELAKLRKGVYLAEGVARIDGATIKKHRKGCTEVEIVLSEGKNREIRRILARAGHKVVVLRRIAIGPLRLALLPVGASRQLTSKEVKALYAFAEASRRAKKPAGRGAAAKKASAKKRPSANSSRSDKKTPANGETPLQVSPGMVGDDLFPWDSFEDHDDDFVGDFSGAGSVGSVLSPDEEEKTPSKGRKSARGKSAQRSKSTAARGTGKKAGGATRRTSSRSASTSKAAKKTSKKSRTGRVGASVETKRKNSSKPAAKGKRTESRSNRSTNRASASTRGSGQSKRGRKSR